MKLSNNRKLEFNNHSIDWQCQLQTSLLYFLELMLLTFCSLKLENEHLNLVHNLIERKFKLSLMMNKTYLVYLNLVINNKEKCHV
jgi:hypothetical protein